MNCVTSLAVTKIAPHVDAADKHVILFFVIKSYAYIKRDVGWPEVCTVKEAKA